ncbi:MAG: RagB/SusD family nutrient uptake outer membrane protein [Flavobacteriaceae bacterium]|nr:MAG: RagB/SusD family nutrient uptake outer membrane protein [Flavobacteriaceae bacterium]
MKKNIFKLFLVCSVLFTAASCSEDFLDKSPTEFINESDLAATGKLNPVVLESILNGIYANMYTTGTGGTSNHDDLGQKGFDIYGDMLSSDMALSKGSYGWYTGLTQLKETIDYTENTNYKPWRFYYRIIRASNLLIKALGGNDAVVEGVNAYNLAQAKAMRAFSYFYLTQYYIKEYDPNAKVLPLYNSPDQPNQPKSLTKDIYDLMISDLEQAVTLLDGFERKAKYQINQDVAKGLLAYVYAATGTSENNLKALAIAEDVAATNPITTKEDLTGGFNNVDTPSWIWGVDITVDQNLGLVSFWGQIDIYTYSYAAVGNTKSMDKNLFDQIRENDYRKAQFFNTPGHKFELTPYKKFYNENRKIFGNRTVTDDYVYMRTEEMILLAAEMAAKENKEGVAKSHLTNLLSNRFDDAKDYAYIDGLSGQDLLDEISLQTRIEMWGEGKSYLNMKRNKLTTNRGPNHLNHVGEDIKYNDERLTFEIPQAEIQDNPFIN